MGISHSAAAIPDKLAVFDFMNPNNTREQVMGHSSRPLSAPQDRATPEIHIYEFATPYPSPRSGFARVRFAKFVAEPA